MSDCKNTLSNATASVPRIIYLDNNATTQPLPEVVRAMIQILGPDFGNPSSAHSGGQKARRALSQARSSVAMLIRGDDSNLVFTSSGTEANNMALRSGVKASAKTGLITTTIEHSSVIKSADALESEGIPVHRLKPNRFGSVDAQAVEALILDKQPALVTVQWVNSETGVINPIREIGEICRAHDVLFHTDAAQAVGKLDIDISALPIDFLTFTAHKFHGPPGVGFIYVRDKKLLFPLLHGGDQEYGLRAGTENIAGIIGAGLAAEVRSSRLSDVEQKLAEIRGGFEETLTNEFTWIKVNGGETARVCNTSNLHFCGIDGQALMAQFDSEGILCSQSSACTSMRPEPSYVLREMGLSEKEAYASVRFSFGEDNSSEEVGAALASMIPIIRRLQMFLA